MSKARSTMARCRHPCWCRRCHCMSKGRPIIPRCHLLCRCQGRCHHTSRGTSTMPRRHCHYPFMPCHCWHLCASRGAIVLPSCMMPLSTSLHKQRGNHRRQGAIVATLLCAKPLVLSLCCHLLQDVGGYSWLWRRWRRFGVSLGMHMLRGCDILMKKLFIHMLFLEPALVMASMATKYRQWAAVLLIF